MDTVERTVTHIPAAGAEDLSQRDRGQNPRTQDTPDTDKTEAAVCFRS